MADDMVVKDGPTPDEVIKFDSEIRRAKIAKDEGVANLRVTYKRAKSSGFSLRAHKMVEDFRKLDPEEAQLVLKQFIAYSVILKATYVGDLPLFKDADNVRPSQGAEHQRALDEAEFQGVFAGQHSVSRDTNPYPAGSELFVRWDKGWRDAQEAATKQGKGIKKEKAATAGKGRVGCKKSDAPPKAAEAAQKPRKPRAPSGPAAAAPAADGSKPTIN